MNAKRPAQEDRRAGREAECRSREKQRRTGRFAGQNRRNSFPGRANESEDDAYTLASLSAEDVAACLGFLRRMNPPAGHVYVGRATRELGELPRHEGYTSRPQLAITARFDDDPDIGYCFGIGRILAEVRELMARRSPGRGRSSASA